MRRCSKCRDADAGCVARVAPRLVSVHECCTLGMHGKAVSVSSGELWVTSQVTSGGLLDYESGHQVRMASKALSAVSGALYACRGTGSAASLTLAVVTRGVTLRSRAS